MDEKDFGRIQKDRETEMQYWAKRVLAEKVPLAIVAENNHYAGSGPAPSTHLER
jgi:hypothetical protein